MSDHVLSDGITGNGPGDINSCDVAELAKRVSELEITLNNVLHEKKLQEEDFAQKRAKFKEIFLLREDELVKEATTAREEKNRLEEELLGLKAAAAVIESTKQEEIKSLKQKYEEEVASFQKVMDEATSVASEETARAYQKERERLLELNESMAMELEEIRGQERRPGFVPEAGSKILTGFSKTFRSLASPGSSPTTAKEEKAAADAKQEAENLEQSMLQAQQHAEIMKSLVMPLEEEIKKLKETNTKVVEENRLLHNKVEKLQSKVDDFQRAKSPSEEVKDLSAVLEREKSSRTDLELFVAVLQKQKDVAQDNVDKLEKDLKDVCQILEKEKAKYDSLMQTWQMANDQFLESQRLQMMDMRRLESVLTEEQQRQVAVLQREDLQREEQEKRVRELEEKRQKLDQEVEKGLRNELNEESHPIPIPPASSSRPPQENVFSSSSRAEVTAAPDINPDDLAEFEGTTVTASDGEFSSPMHRRISEIETTGSMDGVGSYARSDDSHSVTSNYSLTEAQERAITSATPEREQIEQVLESAKSVTEDHPSLVGKRVVSETEWSRLQEEIRSARERVGKPCDLCPNYEKQLQTIQEREQVYRDKINSLNLQIETEHEKFLREQKFRHELEESLKNAAEDAQSQITILRQKNMESGETLSKLQLQYNHTFTEIQNHLMRLKSSRDELYEEVKTLQTENDSLSNKRSLHASIMAEEAFQLPNDMEALQSLCLKYREDMVTLRVNTEHDLEVKQGKLNFLQEQLQMEEHTKTAIEETYQLELEETRKELVNYRNLRDEHEREKQRRRTVEEMLKSIQDTSENEKIQSQQVTVNLREQISELKNTNAKLEKDLQETKSKCAKLQADLQNSEAVQMDFVKLSQSLQVQLENIRQTENEVRWEHEDDVEKCFNCKVVFGSHRKRKVHCRHCGKVHCPDCVSKTVESGHRRRKMPVCDVCHTLLVNDSAPFFHDRPPPTL